MDMIEIIVLVFVIAAMGATLWWFFGEREAATASVSEAADLQEIEIEVKGGYSPDVVSLKVGIPARLNFRREETNPCTEQVVISDFGIVRNLPAHETTSIEFTPNKTGEFAFTCGMNMVHGKLIVQ